MVYSEVFAEVHAPICVRNDECDRHERARDRRPLDPRGGLARGVHLQQDEALEEALRQRLQDDLLGERNVARKQVLLTRA